MRLTLRLLGTEVFHLSTEDEPPGEAGDATAVVLGASEDKGDVVLGFGRWSDATEDE